LTAGAGQAESRCTSETSTVSRRGVGGRAHLHQHVDADDRHGAVLATLPVVIIYIPVQKYVIGRLTSGAVKG